MKFFVCPILLAAIPENQCEINIKRQRTLSTKVNLYLQYEICTKCKGKLRESATKYTFDEFERGDAREELLKVSNGPSVTHL